MAEIRPTRRDDDDRRIDRIRARLDPPSLPGAADGAHRRVERGLETERRGVAFEILDKLGA